LSSTYFTFPYLPQTAHLAIFQLIALKSILAGGYLLNHTESKRDVAYGTREEGRTRPFELVILSATFHALLSFVVAVLPYGVPFARTHVYEITGAMVAVGAVMIVVGVCGMVRECVMRMRKGVVDEEKATRKFQSKPSE
jgi:hypothetical protein